MTHPIPEDYPIGPTRRDCLKTVSAGFGWLALAGLCQQEAQAYESPLAPKRPHFPARETRNFSLYARRSFTGRKLRL